TRIPLNAQCPARTPTKAVLPHRQASLEEPGGNRHSTIRAAEPLSGARQSPAELRRTGGKLHMSRGDSPWRGEVPPQSDHRMTPARFRGLVGNSSRFLHYLAKREARPVQVAFDRSLRH